MPEVPSILAKAKKTHHQHLQEMEELLEPENTTHESSTTSGVALICWWGMPVVPSILAKAKKTHHQHFQEMEELLEPENTTHESSTTSGDGGASCLDTPVGDACSSLHPGEGQKKLVINTFRRWRSCLDMLVGDACSSLHPGEGQKKLVINAFRVSRWRSCWSQKTQAMNHQQLSGDGGVALICRWGMPVVPSILAKAKKTHHQHFQEMEELLEPENTTHESSTTSGDGGVALICWWGMPEVPSILAKAKNFQEMEELLEPQNSPQRSEELLEHKSHKGIMARDIEELLEPQKKHKDNCKRLRTAGVTPAKNIINIFQSQRSCWSTPNHK